MTFEEWFKGIDELKYSRDELAKLAWYAAINSSKDKDIHVMPNNDIKEHIASKDCWCNPTYDGLIYSHKVLSLEYPENERSKLS